MSRHHFVRELESTADRIADASRADLQILLRRAALLLRNVDVLALPSRTEQALNGVATEMGVSRPELIEIIIGEWLSANAYLPVPFAFDEDSGTDGCA